MARVCQVKNTMNAIIEPVYRPVGDRPAFNLGEFNAELISEGNCHQCVVQASMELVPDLRLCLSTQLPHMGFALSIMFESSVQLTYGDGKQMIQVAVYQAVNDIIKFAPNPQAMTICADPCKKLTTGKFHIVNFPTFLGTVDVTHRTAERLFYLGYVILEQDDWIIEIQELPEASETIKKIKAHDLYGMTHVGKVSKKGGKTFNIKDFEKIIDEIYTFLSFVRGLWVPIILPVGFDKDGNKVFEDWRVRSSMPWQNCLTWFDTHNANWMSDLYPKFVDLLRKQDKNVTVRRILDLYIQGNSVGGGIGADSKLIPSQTAMESLAYFCLKKKKGNEKTGEFLHRMCKQLSLPTDIPEEAEGLTTAQRENNNKWEHALHAIVDVRNQLVHPMSRINTSSRINTNKGAIIFDSWKLSQQYVSLSLLNLAGYNGKFSNIVKPQWRGKVEDVPWKKA